MRRITDRIFLSILIFILILCWSLYLTRSFWQSAVIGVAATVLINLIWLSVSARLAKNKTMSRSELFRLLAVMGIEESTMLLYNTLPADMRSELSPPAFIINGDTLVYNNLKFSPTNEEDIAKMYRICKAKSLIKAVFVAARTDRKLMTFAAYLGISTFFPDKIYVKRYLVRHNALPKAPDSVKVKIPRIKLKELFLTVFDRRKAKYYIFSGIMLLLMSMLTPLKLYYLIFASVPLLLAAISLFTKD